MSTHKKNSVLQYAREILRLEAYAITDVENLIDETFEAAVQMILGMPAGGRLIVSGIGKTSFIGMKVSATFASTGVSSFFLHPAEAVHGDLGRYTPADITLMLSNSGETAEILKIIPHIKRIGCKLISITGNSESSLARHSDLVLSIGKLDEAGPLGLAPTTSTTAMLALGDALSMSVFKSQTFSKERFALYHPGGRIGTSLLPVSEVMRKGEEHCITEESTPVKEVLHAVTITKGRPGAASIIDSDGKLAGIFTDGNLRRCLETGSAFLEEPISNVMTRNPKTIKTEQLASEALKIMSEFKIDQLVVVNSENSPVGMIDIQDLVDIGLA